MKKYFIVLSATWGRFGKGEENEIFWNSGFTRIKICAAIKELVWKIRRKKYPYWQVPWIAGEPVVFYWAIGSYGLYGYHTFSFSVGIPDGESSDPDVSGVLFFRNIVLLDSMRKESRQYFLPVLDETNEIEVEQINYKNGIPSCQWIWRRAWSGEG